MRDILNVEMYEKKGHDEYPKMIVLNSIQIASQIRELHACHGPLLPPT